MTENLSKIPNLAKCMRLYGTTDEDMNALSHLVMEETLCCTYVEWSGLVFTGFDHDKPGRKVVFNLSLNGYEDGCYAVVEPGLKIPKLLTTEEFIEAFVKDGDKPFIVFTNFPEDSEDEE